MASAISIWQLANTGVRNPNRIHEGFEAFAGSPYVGNAHTKINEIAFTNYLTKQGIVKSDPKNDGSTGRKWRYAFADNGFIYPKLKVNSEKQAELGRIDEITPFGKTFLKADTFSAVQECFLRSLAARKEKIPETDLYFSPLRWTLKLLLEVEKITGEASLTWIEFALCVQTSYPNMNITNVINTILDLRGRRESAQSKRKFDNNEIDKFAVNYPKKRDNFREYSDANMRYLRLTGIFQKKGRGIRIVPTKKVIAEKLAKEEAVTNDYLGEIKQLCIGVKLPTDDKDTALKLLRENEIRLKKRRIKYKIDDLNLENITEINIARQRLESLLALDDETKYADQQRDKWQEIADYLELLSKGGGEKEYSADEAIKVPRAEAPVYLEWAMWRAMLAIDHMVNKPYESHGFSMDADFLPISTASGGQPDLFCEFENYSIVVEVTLSTSSRQEAMEGEPVRRHVADKIINSSKPVYGLFVARTIDTNTAETFKHGVWYTKKEEQLHLSITPMTIKQFHKLFICLFENNTAYPERLLRVMQLCVLPKDVLEAPEWKRHIESTVKKEILKLTNKEDDIEEKNIVVSPGSTINHPVFGVGRVIGFEIAYGNGESNMLAKLPYFSGCPKNIKIDKNGTTFRSVKFGKGKIISYIVIFNDLFLHFSYQETLKYMI